MSDFNTDLENAEKTIIRLTLQADQEKAMKQTLPYRFGINMAAFCKYFPSIYSIFEDYQVSRPFEFFCSENGQPNLRWLDSNQCIYGNDPYSDCALQIESMLKNTSILQFKRSKEYDQFGQHHIISLNKLTELQESLLVGTTPIKCIPESMSLGLMFGVGLGYQIGYLYEKCQLANLYIFEPDLDLFYASIFTFDWAPLLNYLVDNSMGLHIFLGQEDEDIMSDLYDVMTPHKNNTFLCTNIFGFSHYQSDDLIRLQNKVAREFHLFGMGWGFFDDNLFSLSHSMSNISSDIPFILKDKKISKKWMDVPVFVVANGPSLDASIQFLKYNQDRIIILACGTAISSLYKSGIDADIYVATERVDVVPKSLLGIDPAYLKKIIFLSTDVVHPDCHAFFEKIALVLKADEAMYALLQANTNIPSLYQGITHVNPLVGNIGLSMPLHLGFKNIYLVGLDNGFKSQDHHHSRYSLYYGDDGKPKEEFKYMVLAQGDDIVPANFGGNIKTNKLFSSSISMLEAVIKLFPEANIFNCSDGAKLSGAKSLYINEIYLSEKSIINKNDLLNSIMDEMSTPIAVSKEKIDMFFDRPFFDYFIDKLKEEWLSIPETRFALIQMMQKQTDYLNSIADSQQRHISFVLSGTLNTIYAMISTSAYSVDDEKTAIEIVKKQVPLITEFFDIMKETYKRGLDYVQGHHL